MLAPPFHAIERAQKDAVGGGVAASWQRCLLMHKLDPERPDPPNVLCGAELRECRAMASQLLRVADPELDRLHALTRSLACGVLLTDMRGVVLTHRAADSEEALGRRAKLWDGAVWAESEEGTNGIGTCLVERRPITVHREQHFLRRHTRLSCAVAPVFDAEGCLAGAVDISLANAPADGAMLPLLQMAAIESARRLEAQIFRLAYPRCLIVTLGNPSPASSSPLVALDPDHHIVGATAAAREALRFDKAALASGLAIQDLLEPASCNAYSFADAQRSVVIAALTQTRGNVSAAAVALGISRATLHRRMRELHVERGSRFH